VIESRLVRDKYGHMSIIVVCPKCGREGSLRVRRRNSFGGLTFRIYHSKNDYCSFPLSDPHNAELFLIYNKYRNNGIKYEIVPPKSGNTPKIMVECPKCGKWGRLRSIRKSGFGRTFAIIHEDGTKCTIRRVDERHDELEKLIEVVRG